MIEPTARRAVATPPPDLRGVDRESWIVRNGTPWQRCLRDILLDVTWGVSRRSQFRVSAPLHIVVEDRMWCTAGPAIAGEVHPMQKRCGACLELAKERADECFEDYIVAEAPTTERGGEAT